MSYDCFIEINDIYRCGLLKIAEHDKKIANARNGEKKNLKIERDRLWEDMWRQVTESIPSYSSQIKLLTSMSSEHESLLNILKKRHVEIAFKKGKQIVNDGIKITNTLLETFKKPTIGSLADYTIYSFFLQFTFTLVAPYLSKDDEEFYICENPVRKDKVFKVPMVAGSSWKGNMRWTAGKLIELKVTDPDEKHLKRIQLSKLFGHENESEKRYFNSMLQDKQTAFEEEMKDWSTRKGLRSGRLNFYPTFFDQIGLEVINPHDRKTKAGTQPIYIESVPTGATGTFSLLYVPFDLIGKPEAKVKREVSEDLRLICNALKEMMLTYGFSAKKGSGFGIIKKDFNVHPEAILNIKLDSVKSYGFKSFTELTKVINKIITILEGRDNCPETSEGV